MKQQWLRGENLALSLALLGGAGPAITFLSPVFSTSVRWLILLGVLVWAGTRSRAFAWLNKRTAVLVLACLAWNLTSYFWSMQPTLTIMKAGAFVLVVGALVTAGYRWIRKHGLSDALSFLMPLTILALLAAVLGRTQESSMAQSQGLDLYRGLTGNSNMLGSLMFMIVPLILWKLHLSNGRVKVFWAMLLAITLVILALSVARSSILATLILIGFYGLALSLARRASIIFFSGLGVVTAVLMFPGTLGHLESRYVRKSVATQGSQVLSSREGPWQVSLAMATKGGVIGAGYGVSIDGGRFSGGLTTLGYGREKGNTQLAIMEETGVIGLVLYALIVVSLIARLWQAFSSVSDRNARALIGIVMGAIIGELVVGIFEAWWVAPGAPESIWFWTMVGVALGLTESVLKRPATRAPASVTARSWASGPARK